MTDKTDVNGWKSSELIMDSHLWTSRKVMFEMMSKEKRRDWWEKYMNNFKNTSNI